MTRFALSLAAVSLAALAACSQEPASQAPADEAAQESPAPMPTATVTETSTPPADRTPSPSPTGTDTAAAQSIPDAIRGRWGLVPADCTSTRGDAKGLLTIDADTLRFYESRGILGTIKERSDSRIRATFAFTGEGMTWTREVALDLRNDGRTLVRREFGQDAAAGPFRYARCA